MGALKNSLPENHLEVETLRKQNQTVISGQIRALQKLIKTRQREIQDIEHLIDDLECSLMFITTKGERENA